MMREILPQLDLITQARRGRLVSAKGTVPGVMWAVLLCGGFLTIGFYLVFRYAERNRARPHDRYAFASDLLIHSANDGGFNEFRSQYARARRVSQALRLRSA